MTTSNALHISSKGRSQLGTEKIEEFIGSSLIFRNEFFYFHLIKNQHLWKVNGLRFGDCRKIFNESPIEASMLEKSSKLLDGGGKR